MQDMWLEFCKHCKFGERIYYAFRDNEFFPGDYFYRTLYISLNQSHLYTAVQLKHDYVCLLVSENQMGKTECCNIL